MALNERDVQILVRLRLARVGVVAFRNNVGVAFTGVVVSEAQGVVTLKNARRIAFGLGKGSSDLIGWKSVRITQDLVGFTVAVFTAVEVKAEGGKITPEQANFLHQVRQAGGIAFVAKSEAEVDRGIEQWTP